MMMRRFNLIRRNHMGFTLIEVLVATALTGLIGFGISSAVFQTININAMSNNHVMALKQVESAAFWIERDAQMAQSLQPGGLAGFPLTMSRVEWDNTTHQISYTIQGNQLLRSNSVDGGEPLVTMVAQNIDSDVTKTNCQFSSGVFTFKITAVIGSFRQATETKITEVLPRSAP